MSSNEVIFLGNHHRAQLGERAFGTGDKPAAAFGYVVARGQANSEGIMDGSGLQMVTCRINLGVSFQSDVAATLQFTLSPDPQDPDAVWGNTTQIAPSDIKSVVFPFTGIKVKFGADGGSVCFGAL